jgi:hypothetical protein
MMRGNNDEGKVDYLPLVITCHREYVGRPERRGPLGVLGVYRRMILKWIFKTWDREAWAELIWLRIGTVVGLIKAVMNLRVS